MLRDDRRVDLSNKAIARYKGHGKRFEIIVEPNLALKLKIGEISLDVIDEQIQEMLEIDIIFSNASKGEKANQEDLNEVFGEISDDIFKVASIVLRKGDLQITAAQRNELMEKKKRKIINIISRNCVNPKTGYPHPPARIESALEHGNIRIDPFDAVENQVKLIVKELARVIPIRMEKVKLAVKIPAEHTGKAYGAVKRFTTIEKEQWQSNGDWIAVVEMAAGMQANFFESLEKICKGRAEVKTLSRSKI